MHASIPSPSQGVWNLGPLPIRGYALCIILGIVLAVVIADRRYRARGGRRGLVADVAIWAVPFGIIGGRLYHVATSWQPYFGSGGHPLDAVKIWEGGLGIWGAIALGGVGAYIGCRRQGVVLPPFADAAAPGFLVAQAVGRWGNWFNQELFGKPTSLPWGLQIDAAHRPPGYESYATFQPTFLYESLWCLGSAAVLLWADRRWRLGHGRAFMLYVALYTAGRFWIELLRIDDANHILGLRVNTWVSTLVFVGAVVAFIVSSRLRPGRETPAELLRDPSAYVDPDAAPDDSAAGGVHAEGADGADAESGTDEEPADSHPT
jgi:prolipoprotein diacylglyceryl transferase